MLQHHVVPRLSSAAVVALAVVLSATAASAQTRIGSFVSGERPMYLEIDQLVEGQPFHVTFKNIPPGSTMQTLFFSDRVYAMDLTPEHIPGTLGPDLVYGGMLLVKSDDFTGYLAPGSVGKTFYIQGYAKTPNGGRLTSMVATHPQATVMDDQEPTPVFPIPLTTQEVLTPGKSGWDRALQPVRVGIPLAQGLVVEKSGIPQLTLTGGPKEGQFSTLAKWPDGSCKWVLCEYLKDLAAGQLNTSVAIDRGTGNFGGASLVSASGTVTTIATGPLVFTTDATKDDLFQSFKLNGQEVFVTSKPMRPRFWDDADHEWTWHKTAVNTRRNGPVRAEVEVDGCFTRSTSATDADRVYVRFYLEAFKGGTSIRATTSLRDTSVQFPEHLLFRGLTFEAWLNEPAPFDVRAPAVATNGATTTTNSGTIGTSQDASFMQGMVKQTKYGLGTDYNASSYQGFIERKGNDNYVIEGVCERIGSNYYTGTSASNWFSTETEYCDPSFMEVTSAQSGHGVLFGVEHACRTWPVEFQGAGDGRVTIGIFPHKASADTYNYPLTYASAETRCFYIVAESQRAVDPIKVAGSFDYPVVARSETWAYNQAKVWPWMLASTGEVQQYITFAGMRGTQPVTINPVRTVYRFAGGTGGGNNNWGETHAFLQWLRSGNGSAYLSSWFETYYKADKMAWSIDDAALKDRKSVRNPAAPVTKKGDFFDGSKHTFFQSVHDWAFTHGETYLLDSAKHFAATVIDRGASPNVFPNGNFVQGTFGAITSAGAAILAIEPNQALEDWLHLVLYQWANVVYQQSNSFGVKTDALGWQATVGTPEGSALNPDGYMITWSAGKPSDKAKFGYMSQMWTDLRGNALAFQQFVHYLREKNPSDPLIADLLQRAPDMYHYARRGMPDDHCKQTGEYYINDVFKGDANDQNADHLLPPGDDIAPPNGSGYSLQGICNLLLELRKSETAYSYGVELHRSMLDPTYNAMVNDPELNDFIWRYLRHYGLITP